MTTSHSLPSGKCPECSGTEIYSTKGIAKRGERTELAVSSMKRISLDTYFCAGCGHFEERVPQETLDDKSLVDKIRNTWTRV